MAEQKRRIKTKIPHLTPNQKRLLLLQEEKKQAQAKLKEIRQQIEPVRLKAKKKEESLRRLEEKISGDFRSTSKSSNIVTQEQLEEIPLQIRDDVVEEDLNIVFKPNPGPQTEFLAATEKEVFYGGARGGGKGGCYTTEIITPFGKRMLQDIHVGDIILNPDGGPQEVIKETELGIVPVYRFYFIDGSTTEVSDDHLWLIHKTSSSSKKESYSDGFFKGELWLTKEIREWLDKKNSSDSHHNIKKQNLIIPLCSPLKFTKTYRYNPITIHPYVLGCLLGDGCITNKQQLEITSADSELIDRIRELGFSLSESNNSISYRFYSENNLANKLYKLNLLGHNAKSKFIPECYKWASLEDRFELIKGLMDTDGYADERGHLEYCTISKQLAEDIRWVLKSLGAKVTIREKIPTFTYNGIKKQGQLAYILYIQSNHNDKFFYLDRKRNRCIDKEYNGAYADSLGLRIEKVEYIGDHQCKCITVRNPNGLYLQDDFIVTHNSYSLLVDPLRYCDKTNARALILRRTMPELRDLINHSQRLYDKAFPGAKWREQEKEWRFPSGARIEFGYAETPQDALRYQGQAYTWIGVDELPQFPTPEIWNELKGSLRSVDPNIPEYMRACVDEGDVLTLDGWKAIQNIKIGELVYSLNKNKEIVVKPVTNIYEYNVNEKLVRYYNKGLYLSITNDHKVVHSKSPRHLTMSIDRYNQINNKRINIYRHGIKYNSCGIDNKILELEPELYLEILGYFLSEGCTTTRNRVIISQKKKESKNIIRACLNKTNLKWIEDSSGFTLHNNLVWYNHFKQFGKSIDKFIPRNILNTASQDQANILLNALILGDGHRSKFDYIEYYTISKQLWDDVAELAFKACYKVWQRKRERPKYSCNTQYELSIRQNNTPTSELNKTNEKLELYKGKVYCISVEETQTFVLRQKGAIMISGNTGNP